MSTLWEILTFRQMVSPIVLQILFWAGIGGTLYGTYVLYRSGNALWPLPLIFGPLVVRVLFESWLLAYRPYDQLGEIRDLLQVTQ